jgi:hypothetical protein
MRLTGRNVLRGYASNEDAFRALMSSGATGVCGSRRQRRAALESVDQHRDGGEIGAAGPASPDDAPRDHSTAGDGGR